MKKIDCGSRIRAAAAGLDRISLLITRWGRADNDEPRDSASR